MTIYFNMSKQRSKKALYSLISLISFVVLLFLFLVQLYLLDIPSLLSGVQWWILFILGLILGDAVFRFLFKEKRGIPTLKGHKGIPTKERAFLGWLTASFSAEIVGIILGFVFATFSSVLIKYLIYVFAYMILFSYLWFCKGVVERYRVPVFFIITEFIIITIFVVLTYWYV